MDATVVLDRERYRDGEDSTRAVRWLITAVAALALVALFLLHGSSAEAAAPMPNDDVVYHEMAAPYTNCLNGDYRFCTYNLGYAGYAGYGCILGNLSCNVNYVYPTFNYNYNGCYLYLCGYGARYYGGFYSNYIFANNACPSGNFTACFNGNVCPSGNFTACFGGNFSYFTNPFFFGYTGVVPTNVTVIAPGGNAIAVGPPFRPKEVGTPTVVTQSDAPAAVPAPAPVVVTTSVAAAPVAVTPAQVAAPVTAAPSGNMATALNAAPASVPEAAPAGGTGVKILSAPAASAPAAKVENGRDDRD